ncbi:hypothetical protein E9549_02665 [Blastococcus sp. MG754426]|uniref:hypothetical protein n=1 Tax=unclassified Blastococcus TaxID=2619396 RepID=UPI001EF111CE|nr:MULTISPECIES: hypothetical protein [unclassified Blastococcus]MCF6506314.1 hypothetical protein [Blastococcus sp. MG754426]MCF6510870.1 hypothetical protein [Blastococcus sp. MG754427]
MPRGPLRSTRTTPVHLTDRELEGVTPVRGGRSEAGIAAVLHPSPRTVVHHVAGSSTELGVTTRAEAVARTADADLF